MLAALACRNYCEPPQQSAATLGIDELIMRDPLRAAAWVVEQRAGHFRYRGTCFGFRHPGVLLTAKHCVEGARPEDLSIGIFQQPIDLNMAVQSGGGPKQAGLPIVHIEPHPTADIAVIRVQDFVGYFDRFEDAATECELGELVAAFGYPEETADTGVEPTPRFFRGNVQRQFYNRSHTGCEYHAVELSFAAPAGLSGGPVSLATHPELALGIVVENHRSSTLVDTIEGETIDRPVREVHSVVNYAICLLLAPLRPWLAAKAVPADGRRRRDT